MVKKKQPDFQKTKLRVGKTLPKGRNVTDTSFKTRKIVTRDQLNVIPGNVSLKDLLNYLGHNNVSTKKETLHKLNNYVLEKKDTLSLFFSDILKKVGGTLLESDASVRAVAIDVMHTCLNLLSDVQISCFFNALSSYLKCMMTHCNNDIRKDSLKFLEKILNTHPNVICYSVKVLSSLLNLISSVVFEKNTSKGRKRKLDELISSNITSQDWRVAVLTQIYVFLQHALETENVYEVEDEDEREIYWDGQKPLYLPLYLRGGTTPVPLESHDSNSRSMDTKEFKDFIYDLFPLLLAIIKGEVSMKKSSTSNVVEPAVVKQLHVVTQVLCCVGEWLYHKSSFQITEDKEFMKLINTMICQQLLKCFPYAQHGSSHIKKKVEIKIGTECMQLNLGVCYLYFLFIHDTDAASSEIGEALITYLKDLFCVCNSMCWESIALVIKICKLCIKSPNMGPTYKNGILVGLYGILEVHKFHPCAKAIYSFFMNVSLNYEYKNLLDSEGMMTWFKVILKEMVIMMESGDINKKFLKYIRQLCARKYPYFIELVNKDNHKDFLELLRYDDEDFQLTIIQLILSLHQPCSLLQDLVEILRDPAFSLKTSTRIIHILHTRFLGIDVPGKEKLLFLIFLLNLACDVPYLTDPEWKSVEISSDTLRYVYESCQYQLLPSSKWERHSKISKACFECLPAYVQLEKLSESSVVFAKAVLKRHSKLPIHSAIAFLLLRKQVKDIYQDDEVVTFYSELIFSSLMYLSVMLINCEEEDLDPYAVPELQKSLQLDQLYDVPEVVQVITSNIHNFGEKELYHVLRITLYLINSRVLLIDDGTAFYSALQEISSNCRRSKLLHPLWLKICKFFQFL